MMGSMMQKGGSGSYEEDAPKKMSFKQAFASARKGGEKTFEWNGKKYTTELAKPKAESAERPKTDAVSRHREVKRGLDAIKASAPTEKGPISKAYAGEGMPSAPAMPKGRMASGPITDEEYKKGGSVKKYAQGGSVSGRADGIAKKGKTNCKMV